MNASDCLLRTKCLPIGRGFHYLGRRIFAYHALAHALITVLHGSFGGGIVRHCEEFACEVAGSLFLQDQWT